MPYRYYFLLIGGLIVVPFLTGHFVWQTIPYIAVSTSFLITCN